MTNSYRLRGRAMARGYNRISNVVVGSGIGGNESNSDFSPVHESGINTGTQYRKITRHQPTEAVRSNAKSFDIVDTQLSQSFASKSLGEINISHKR